MQGDLKYASIAIEHGARVQGLLLQLDAADSTARPDKDAQEAIRRVQALGQSQGGNRP